MIGPQADFRFPVNPAATQYSGQLYSQNTSRGILAWRGQVVQIQPAGMPELVGTIGDRDNLGKSVKNGEWNQYEVIARGGVILHILNGQLMAVQVDDNPTSSNNISASSACRSKGFRAKSISAISG